MTVIESKLKLVKVAIKMLHREFMVRTNNGSLKQAPDVLQSVGMNIAEHVLSRAMIHSFVLRVVVGNGGIDAVLIGANRSRLIGQLRFNERLDRVVINPLDCLHSHFAATLNRAQNNRLVDVLTAGTASFLLLPDASVHVFGFAADERLVHFNDAVQKRSVRVLDRFTNAMAEIPCGLVGYFQRALELVGRHPFFRFGQQIDSGEPLHQRQVRVVENSPGGYAKMILA